MLRRVLLANGLDMTKGDYELLALGATGARLDSMIKGETFAGVLNSPFDLKALDAGMKFIGGSLMNPAILLHPSIHVPENVAVQFS